MKFTQPIKIVFAGNKSACHNYIRFAAKQLSLLEQQMSFQRLKQGRRIVSPIHGVLVECLSRFNYKEVRIHVQPEPAKSIGGVAERRDKQQDERKYQECIPYYFYVRIECPNINPGLTTDRLIIYEMEFNGLQSNTPLEDSYNASNNFTPGGGRVIADVDVLSETVYFPEGLTLEDQARMVSMVKSIAENTPNIGNPQLGPTNYFDEWYVTGPLTNIPDSIILADYSGTAELPDEPTEIYLSEGIDVSSDDTFWFFTDPLEIPKYYTNGHYAYELWRADWSPLYGGKTTWYTNTDWLTYEGEPENFTGDGYPWEDLQQVAEAYYGKYVIMPTGNLDQWEILEEWYFYGENVCDLEGHYDCRDSQGQIYGTGEPRFSVQGGGNYTDEMELTSGEFYTSKMPGGAPSFFIARKGFPKDRGKSIWTSSSCDNGLNYDLGMGYAPHLGMTAYTTTELRVVTPLEDLDILDFKIIGDGDANCSEFVGTAFEKMAAWQVISRVGLLHESCNGGADDIARIKICEHWGASRDELTFTDETAETSSLAIHTNAQKNSNTISENWRHTSCFILDDPEQENRSCQTKFASLFYFDEMVLGGESGLQLGTFAAQCDGVVWDDRPESGIDKAKKTYQRDIGCLLYIFAPQQMTGVDEYGNTTYWDIHSGRVDSNYINPFRCLGFEEYLLDVFKEIGRSLDDNPALDKLRTEDPPVAHTMEYYGYEIRSGFFRGG